MPTKRSLRICPEGHEYYKSTDCPTCPVCEKIKKPPTGFLSPLSSPARRALTQAGINTVNKLATYTEKDILALHGIGKASLPALHTSLAASGLSFKAAENSNKNRGPMQLSPEVTAYIARFPRNTQQRLEELRSAIISVAGKAEEGISYQMPAYKYHGMLAYFAGYENHIGFYPTPSGIETFKKELSAYKGAKGSVQFPHDKPLPVTLIKQIVQFRLAENETIYAHKKDKRKK